MSWGELLRASLESIRAHTLRSFLTTAFINPTGLVERWKSWLLLSSGRLENDWQRILFPARSSRTSYRSPHVQIVWIMSRLIRTARASDAAADGSEFRVGANGQRRAPRA